MWAGLLLALVLTILVGVRPSPACADGDPASDVLVSEALFLPADAAIPARDQLRLVSLLDAAKQNGLPIRVAIISSPSDLGAVSELWDQPRAYARFLGFELSLTSQAQLLVVMPDGVGYNSPGHPAPGIYDLVGRIPAGRSGSALVSAAQAAVISVAETAHVRLVATPRPAGARLLAPTPWRPTTDRVFGLAGLAALAAMFAGCLISTRWRSAVPTLITKSSSAPVERTCTPRTPVRRLPVAAARPRQSPLPPVADEPAAQPQLGRLSARRQRAQ